MGDDSMLHVYEGTHTCRMGLSLRLQLGPVLTGGCFVRHSLCYRVLDLVICRNCCICSFGGPKCCTSIISQRCGTGQSPTHYFDHLGNALYFLSLFEILLFSSFWLKKKKNAKYKKRYRILAFRTQNSLFSLQQIIKYNTTYSCRMFYTKIFRILLPL